MLTIDNLNIYARNFPDNKLVKEVNFSLPENSVFNLVGETGSGKSVLAWAVAGLLPDDLKAEGRITIAGLSSQAAESAVAHEKAFLIPQEPGIALDPTMKIRSQVAEIFRWPGEKPRKLSQELACAVLSRLGLSKSAANSYPHQLSGGMNQRCAVAMALSSPAPLIIVDEPTKGLDSNLKLQTVKLFGKLIENGKTLLCITHDFSVAGLLGGRTGVMLRGEVIEQGLTEQVLNDPEKQYTKDLIRALPENGLCAPLN